MKPGIKGFDVLIVGGGAIGCAIARRVASAGAHVGIVERGHPGQGATWAAAGMLTQLAEGGAADDFRLLCSTSLELYPEFVASLEGDSGIDVGYRRMETVVAAFTDADAGRLAARLAIQRSRGVRVEWHDGAPLRQLEPSLSADVRGGLVFGGEGQIENRALGQALWTAATRAGVEVLEQRSVRGIDVESDAVRGVRLADGSIEADQVIIAGGAWSGQLTGLPRPLPVRPVRGQMLALESTSPQVGRIVSADHVYVVPRRSGRTLIGATVEETGFQVETTAGGLHALLEGALRVLPVLADATVVETWAGLRPGTPDDMPVLGRDPRVKNLLYATGHFMNGILLTPITARIIEAVLQDREPLIDIEPYSIGRFPLDQTISPRRGSPLTASD